MHITTTIFQKRLSTLRNQLIGRRYFYALAALEYAGRYHTGIRKDKMTPELDHQVQISLYHLTLPDLIDPEGVIVADILHDTPEDYPVRDFDIMEAIFSRKEDREFGRACTASINLLNKYNVDGSPKDEEKLFYEMARDPRASITKPGDRLHNFKTMIGVFSYEKQASYIEFAERLILPMMKAARRTFPAQNAAYENMKHMMLMQIDLIREIHSVAERNANVMRIPIAAVE